MVAPIYDALTKGEFEITMSARGEIKDVKVPDEVLAAMKNSPGAAMRAISRRRKGCSG